MSSQVFRVAFNGPAFEGGEIDVNNLAPALLALGEVVQRANEVLNKDRAHARLKLRAAEKGCFEAFLSIDVSVVDAIWDMLDSVSENPDRVVAANQIFDLLIKGGTVAGGAVGLFSFLKIFGKKRPDTVVQLGSGLVEVRKGEATVVVDKRLLSLLEDRSVRQAVQDFGQKALEPRGVDSVDIGEKAGTDVRFQREDVQLLHVPSESDEEEIEEVDERDALLKIVTSHFRDGYKWRFADGGEKPFTAEMADSDFLKEAQEGKVSLSASDVLRCRLEIKQMMKAGVLSKEIKVLKVIEHIPGAKQLRLF